MGHLKHFANYAQVRRAFSCLGFDLPAPSGFIVDICSDDDDDAAAPVSVQMVQLVPSLPAVSAMPPVYNNYAAALSFDRSECIDLDLDGDDDVVNAAATPDDSFNDSQSQSHESSSCVSYKSNVITNFISMPHLELAGVAAKLTRSVYTTKKRGLVLSTENQSLKKKLKNIEESEQQLKVHVGQMKRGNDFDANKLGQKKDGRGGRLTDQGAFAVGIRRCLTNIAACDFGLCVQVDISGQTVMRCEEKTGAATIYLMKLFMEEALDFARGQHHQSLLDDSNAPWSLTCIAFRSDATNSSIWRREKLHVVEASAMWVSDFDALADFDFKAAVSRRQCV